MRARPRPLAMAATAAAVTAASLPLWASTAGAGGTPDEQHQSTKTVNVNGVDCQIVLYSERYIDMVYASTDVITTADQCRAIRVSVGAVFTTPSGDTASAAAGAEDQGVDVNGGGAADLVRTTHTVGFVNGPSVSYTMASK